MICRALSAKKLQVQHSAPEEQLQIVEGFDCLTELNFGLYLTFIFILIVIFIFTLII